MLNSLSKVVEHVRANHVCQRAAFYQVMMRLEWNNQKLERKHILTYLKDHFKKNDVKL